MSVTQTKAAVSFGSSFNTVLKSRLCWRWTAVMRR